MAVRVDATGEGLSRTTGLPSITAFTVMGWYNYVSFRNFGAMFSFGPAGSGTTYYNGYTTSTGEFRTWQGGSVSGSTLSTSTWYHVAFVVDGTGAGNFRAYLNGALDITNNGNTISGDKIWLSNDPDDEWADAITAGVKIYDAALTVDEINNERFSYMPRRVANLNAWHPLIVSRTADISGAGNNLTENGTLADADGPPLQWGGAVLTVSEVPAAAGSQPWQVRGQIVPGTKLGFGGQYGVR